MRLDTPVTTRAMTADRGSQRRSKATRRSPETNHWYPRRIWVRSSPECDSSSKKAATATTKAAATARVAIQPARARRRWPNSTLTANPARGRTGSSQIRRVAPVAFRAPSPLEQVDVVDRDRRALAEDGDKDAEADHDLGGGHHHHEEGQHLAVQGAVGLGEGDERQVDRVQHQLDAHEHHDGVAPDQHSGHADAEQDGRQEQVRAGPDPHGRCRFPRTRAPTAATTSRTPAVSKAKV